jgi:hypothetical protein
MISFREKEISNMQVVKEITKNRCDMAKLNMGTIAQQLFTLSL